MKDLHEAIVDAAIFDREIVVGLQGAVTHTIAVATQKARSEHHWQDRTYDTRNSIKPEVRDNANGATGTITAGKNAVRLNDGTRPHVITAHDRTERGRNEKGQYTSSTRPGALRFSMGGQVFFRRSVNHPGTKPDSFLDAAADAAGEELPAAVEHAIDEALG